MLSGFILECEGGFPVLTVSDVERYNQTLPSADHLRLDDPKIVELLSTLGTDGVPVEKPGGGKCSELFTAPSLAQLEIGKNKEGYWTGADQIEQVR